MCATTLATVLEVTADGVVIEFGGERRQTPLVLVDDLQAGEIVLYGLGAVLSRVDPTDAERLTAIRSRIPTTVGGL